MFENIRAIVLHTIKYSDKNSIVQVITSDRGRMAFLLPQGNGKVARMRNAMFLPLSILDFEAKISPTRDIHTFRSPQLVLPLTGVYSDPVKSAIAMFIAELIGKVVQGGEENNQLFRYLSSTINILEEYPFSCANFHLCFLFHLGSFLGIQPDTGSYSRGAWFDMENGLFTESQPIGVSALNPAEARIIMLLSRMNFNNMFKFNFNRTQRNEILDLMLKYYKIHNSTIGTLKSPDILKQLFE